MAKEKISSPDLAWIFIERLKALGDCPQGVAVAIVPDEKAGWFAVLQKPYKNTRPIPPERVEKIQRSLQRLYRLSVE